MNLAVEFPLACGQLITLDLYQPVRTVQDDISQHYL